MRGTKRQPVSSQLMEQAMTDHTAVMAAVAVAYLFPSIVAALRRHHQQNAIAVLNILLGWTLLGWIGALVWASTATRREQVR
jgi:hypothetical protein